MALVNLFIADVDEGYLVNVLNSMAHSSQIRVVGYAGDGVTALQQISALHPQVLLTDVQLPGLDGIELIRLARAMKLQPVCIACTRFYSDVVLDAAQMSGASYCLYKPVNYDRLPHIVLSCWEMCRRGAAIDQKRKDDVTIRFSINRLREILTEMGFPVRMHGSLYILETMLQLESNPTLMKNLSKGLYANLADKLRSTPSAVERSLRTAISYAYDRGALSTYFEERPSNRVFLEYLRKEIATWEEDHGAPKQ